MRSASMVSAAINEPFLVATNVAKDDFYKKVVDSQKKYSSVVVPYRMSYWPNYNFIGEHYYKEKIWLK